MAKLGAEVVASDLGPNLRLLRDNCTLNGGKTLMLHETIDFR